jgi:hypothetical protein
LVLGQKLICPGSLLTLVLAILFLIAYRDWIFNFSISSQGDLGFFFKETMVTLRLQYFNLWLPDAAFGRIIVDVGQAPTYSLYGFFAKYFGANYAIAERLVHLWPIVIITPIGIWTLLKEFFKTPWARFTGVIVYCCNTYILGVQTGDVTLAVAWAFAPLVFFNFRRTVLTRSYFSGIKTAIVGAICCAYEPRVFYIVLWLLFGYAVFTIMVRIQQPKGHNLIKNLFCDAWFSFFPILTVLLLNIFWLYGLASIKSGVGTGVIRSSLWGSQYYNIKEAFTLYEPFWKGAQPFVSQPIPLYFWLVPILVISGLYLNRRRSDILFFGMIACVGILLAKQSDLPLPSLYVWLFHNFPGFNAYREASKFYGIIALSYSVILASLVEILFTNTEVRNVHITKWAVLVLLSTMFLLNLVPFITESTSLSVLLTPRHIPNDYMLVKNFILKQQDFSRIAWLPEPSRWSIYTYDHPRVSVSDEVTSDWSSILDEVDLNSSWSEEQTYGYIFSQPFAKEIFSIASIKYVVVPLRDTSNDDDFFGEEYRQFYIDTLDNVKWLKQINIGTKQVAIYENPYSEPYIDSATKMINLNNLSDLAQKYNFVTRVLHTEFSFAPPGASEPGTELNSLFDESISLKNVNGDVLTVPKNPSQSNAYININYSTSTYQVTNHIFHFLEYRNAGLLANNQPLGPQVDNTLNLASLSISPNDQYVLDDDTNLLSIDSNNSSSYDLGHLETDPKLDKVEPGNLLVNANLENGLWKKKVSDCNDYDADPLIKETLIHAVDSRSSNTIQLIASRHTACSGPATIPVTPQETLMIRFNYQVKFGNEAGYRIIWGGLGKVSQNYLPVSDSSWRTLQMAVVVPKGATSFRLLVEAFPKEHQPGASPKGISNYSNLLVAKLSTVSVIPEDVTPQYVNVTIPKNTKQLSIKDYNLTGKNLIPDSRLNNGLWQKSVGDCNNYDADPDIGMYLDSHYHIMGEKSLELEAKRHIACTGPGKVMVKENHAYLLSFDYQSPNSSTAGFSLSFNDPNHTVINETGITVPDIKWHVYDKIITAPYGANDATLTFYADAQDPPNINVINRYDNFHFIEIPDVNQEYYTVSNNATTLASPQHITYNESSPTKKIIDIIGAKSSFYLTMSETYNPQWRLEMNNSNVHGFESWLPTYSPNIIPVNDHFELDDFLNGWYININLLCKQQHLCTHNKDGSYNLSLQAEFTPQRDFDAGLIVSGLTLTGCITFLIFYYKNHRKIRKVRRIAKL